MKAPHFLHIFLLLSILTFPVLSQWIQVSNGLTDMNVYAIASGPNSSNGTNLYAGTAAKGIFRSSDDGSTWLAVGSTGLDVRAIIASGSNVIAGTNGRGTYISTDFGSSWSPLPKYSLSAFVMAPHRLGGKRIVAGAVDGSFVQSTDNGLTWSALAAVDSTTIRSLTATTTGDTLFAGTDLGVYRSTDGGTSWSLTSLRSLRVGSEPYSFGEVYSVVLAAGTDGQEVVFAGRLWTRIWRSANYGSLWDNFFGNGISNSNVWTMTVTRNVGGLAGSSLFAGTDGGVFYSNDLGTTWTRANYGLTNIRIRAFAVSGPALFTGTWGGGIWKRPISNVTGVEKRSSVIPNVCQLMQNYPNPFNPSTTIEYVLPREAWVVLRITNVLGQQIAKLVNSRQGPGIYRMDWNPADLPSGVYYCRLEIESYTQTRKMILQK